MESRTISKPLRMFFDVEERNYEAMMSEFRLKQRPELKPPIQTLATALDSLQQAPNDIIIEWFGYDPDNERSGLPMMTHLIEMAGLIVSYGPNWPLSRFI